MRVSEIYRFSQFHFLQAMAHTSVLMVFCGPHLPLAFHLVTMTLADQAGKRGRKNGTKWPLVVKRRVITCRKKIFNIKNTVCHVFEKDQFSLVKKPNQSHPDNPKGLKFVCGRRRGQIWFPRAELNLSKKLYQCNFLRGQKTSNTPFID